MSTEATAASSTDSVIIVAALVRREGGEMLLVEQQGPWDAEPSWMLPGGRMDPGETLLGAAPGAVYRFDRR